MGTKPLTDLGADVCRVIVSRDGEEVSARVAVRTADGEYTATLDRKGLEKALSPEGLQELLADLDVLYHAAAESLGFVEDPALAETVDQLYEAARAAKP